MSDESQIAERASIPCTWMRGGTSKGGFFLARDLPAETSVRDYMLKRIMGSPDPRQIDGMGGAHPLTSKIAIVGPSEREDCDVDYLFLQIQPDTGEVSASQNCGNMLSGVGPFAIEKGLAASQNAETIIRVHMVNSKSRADLKVQTPGGEVSYHGDTEIDGVPGRHAPVVQSYFDTAGAQCGALLPTSNLVDAIDGVEATLIDNGMPVVLMRAEDLGVSGYEDASDLESNDGLKARIEAIRLKAGEVMGLGNVASKTIPKMCLVSPANSGGLINTRMFIPHRVHQSVGVLAAASVVAACALPGSVATSVLDRALVSPCRENVEHPSGQLAVEMEWYGQDILRTGFVRTARKLMEGEVFL
ncbi:MAG: 4-oxalomesaconate tautomerase [Pseudomonadota bacterium]